MSEVEELFIFPSELGAAGDLSQAEKCSRQCEDWSWIFPSVESTKTHGPSPGQEILLCLAGHPSWEWHFSILFAYDQKISVMVSQTRFFGLGPTLFYFIQFFVYSQDIYIYIFTVSFIIFYLSHPYGKNGGHPSGNQGSLGVVVGLFRKLWHQRRGCRSSWKGSGFDIFDVFDYEKQAALFGGIFSLVDFFSCSIKKLNPCWKGRGTDFWFLANRTWLKPKMASDQRDCANPGISSRMRYLPLVSHVQEQHDQGHIGHSYQVSPWCVTGNAMSFTKGITTDWCPNHPSSFMHGMVLSYTVIHLFEYYCMVLFLFLFVW